MQTRENNDSPALNISLLNGETSEMQEEVIDGMVVKEKRDRVCMLRRENTEMQSEDSDSMIVKDRCDTISLLETKTIEIQIKEVVKDTCDGGIKTSEEGPQKSTNLLQEDNYTTPDNSITTELRGLITHEYRDAKRLFIEKTEVEKNERNADIQMSKCGIYKNLVVYSISFMFLFSSLKAFQNIQSTVNIENGLGTTGLATLYVTMVLTNLFATLLTLPLLTYKYMTIVAMVTYAVFVATGFYSTWYTFIPASVIIGFGASHLWPTQQAYVTRLAQIHAANTNTKLADALKSFFGVFFGLFYTSQIWGNLCSSVVFGSFKDITNASYPVKQRKCGSEFCAVDAVNVFTGFCVSISVLALLMIILFLTNDHSATNHATNGQLVTSKRAPSKTREVYKKVSGVFRLLLTSRDQQLLIAATILGGMMQAFLAGDFSVAFVSCPYGVGSIGFVMITYGVASSIFSFIVSKLSKYVGHLVLFSIGIASHLSVTLTMLLWSPDPDKPIIVFILAAVWGIGDAVYQPMTMSLYSLYFGQKLETALSSYRVLNSVGWAVSFSYSSWLCTDKKIYILQALLCISMICLVILHCKHKGNT